MSTSEVDATNSYEKKFSSSKRTRTEIYDNLAGYYMHVSVYMLLLAATTVKQPRDIYPEHWDQNERFRFDPRNPTHRLVMLQKLEPVFDIFTLIEMSTNDKGYPHHFYGTPDRYRLAESKKAKSERVINYQRIQYKDKEIMISNAEEIGKPVYKRQQVAESLGKHFTQKYMAPEYMKKLLKWVPEITELVYQYNLQQNVQNNQLKTKSYAEEAVNKLSVYSAEPNKEENKIPPFVQTLEVNELAASSSGPIKENESLSFAQTEEDLASKLLYLEELQRQHIKLLQKLCGYTMCT